MSDARRGYNHALVTLVARMDQTSTIAQFASHCINSDISVQDVSVMFGVTRATVYYWFKGVYTPRERQLAKMQEILSKVGATASA